MIVELHQLSTWMMVGIIWFVQLVHYPLFSYLKADFINYERNDFIKSFQIVFPIMLAELLTGVALFWQDVDRWIVIVGLILLIVIWIITFSMQFNIHKKLFRKRSSALISRLIRSNWIRTALWSVRGLLVFAL